MKQANNTLSPSFKVPSFVSKLQEILAETDNSPVIEWGDDGKSFIIKNIKAFEDQLLPRYFRHSRMSSFVRQLNMYGFHKVRTTSDLIIFSHQSFQKDNLENAVVLRKSQGPPISKKHLISSSTETPTTKISLEAQISQSVIQSSSIQQIPDIPISELVLKLVQEVNDEQLILECDIKSKVKDLLRQQPYNRIDRKFTPFILDSLGVESQPSLKNISNLNIGSQIALKTHNFIQSLKFIL